MAVGGKFGRETQTRAVCIIPCAGDVDMAEPAEERTTVVLRGVGEPRELLASDWFALDVLAGVVEDLEGWLVCWLADMPRDLHTSDDDKRTTGEPDAVSPTKFVALGTRPASCEILEGAPSGQFIEVLLSSGSIDFPHSWSSTVTPQLKRF